MQASETKRIVKEKSYRSTEFINNMQMTVSFIQGVNNINIDSQAFVMLRLLIKFFQFPILILFKPFYQRIEADKLIYIKEFDNDLISLGSIAKAIMGDRKFPNLQFYLKAGYHKEFMDKLNFPKVQKMEKFMDFVCVIDKSIDKIHSFQLQKEEGSIKNVKEKIADYRSRNKVNVMEDLCLSAYQKIIQEKYIQIKAEINKQQVAVISLPSINPQQNRNTSSNVIQIEKGKPINDPSEAGSFLCCRTYFYFNQIIAEPETMYQEYKNYEFPYSKYYNQILMKTICGFLNGKGGIIYIGIKQKNQTFKRTVVGHTYNEGQKEEVHKHFRRICQHISPDIVNNPLYKLEYVPLRESEGKYSFVQGRYIIRLKILKGQQKELYSFCDYEKNDYFAFRTPNQVLVRKIGQQILETYRTRLQQKEEDSFSHHTGPCRIPQQGKFIYDSRPLASVTSYPSNRPYIKQKQRVFDEQSTTVKIQPPKMTLDANTHNQIFFIVQQKPYLQQFSNYYQVEHMTQIALVPTYKQQEKQIFNLLVSNKVQFYKASYILIFPEHQYQTIVDILTQEKILFAFTKNRQRIQFSKVQEVMTAVKQLQRENIQFSFTQ